MNAITRPITGRRILTKDHPDVIRRNIATLMADGRERTAEDIANRIGQTADAVRANIRIMVHWGLIRSENIRSRDINLTIYRRANQ